MSPSFALLLRPRILGLRNAWRQADRARKFSYSFFLGLTLLFWLGVFGVCWWFLDAFYGLELIGPIVIHRAFGILFSAFLALLTGSNVITALSSYFLSADMQLIQALPLGERRVFYFRFLDSVLSSSWMILIFGLPPLVAYGLVVGAGPLYYLVALAGLAAYLVPPAALGVAIAFVLVRGFSAGRIREMMTFVSAAFLIGILLFVRSLRPEQLVDPDRFETLAEAIAAIQTIDSAWLPSTWLLDLCFWAGGDPGSLPWLSLGLLFVAGPAVVVVTRWAVAPIWFEAWSRAQEAPKKTASRSPLVNRVIDRVTANLSPVWRALLRKDIRLFLREPGQWIQGIMLLGLVAVYAYSMSFLSPEKLEIAGAGPWRNVLIFLNLGVGASVVAAIAVRFSFTAVSQEGRAFWVLHASPIGARRYLWSKFLTSFVPSLILGETLVLTTNALLAVEPLYGWIAAVTIAAMCFGLTGLAVGMGALYPNFKADSAARMASGPGAILFMVLALSFVAFMVTLEAVPVGALLYKQSQGQPPGGLLIGALVAVAVIVVAANVAATLIPLHRGAAKLWGDLGNVGD